MPKRKRCRNELLSEETTNKRETQPTKVSSPVWEVFWITETKKLNNSINIVSVVILFPEIS